MSDEPADYAELLAPDAEQKKGAPPVFVLAVPRWAADASKKLVFGLHECDFKGHADRDASKKDAPLEKKTLIAEFTLDLLPHAPAKGDDPAAPVKWVVSGAKVKAGKANVLGSVTTPRKGKASRKGKSDGADLTVLLGETRFHLRVPDGGFFEEGRFYEIGWELADATGAHRWAQLEESTCQQVPGPPDVLTQLRGLKTKPMGALVKLPDAKRSPLKPPFVDPKKPMGRFGDPERKPPVPPDAIARLDDDIVKRIEAVRGGASGGADVDGLAFAKLLPASESRASFVERFAAENPTIKAARDDASKDYPLHTTDIRKAYFVIHDVGVGDAPRGKDHYGEKPTALAKRRKSVAGLHVHGFLNHNGSFAVSRDLGSPGGPGTVYENLKEGAWMGDLGIAIECVPVAMGTKERKELEKERKALEEQRKQDEKEKEEDEKIARGELPPLTEKEKKRRKKRKRVKAKKKRWSTHDGYPDDAFVSAGTSGKWYYRWPAALIDGLADLYIYASARSAHLLTMTAHTELDRNVMHSLVFFEHTKAEVKAFKGYYANHRNAARDVHGDPYGLDMQVLYERITDKLNALKGPLQLPKGLRYGIHPLRVMQADGEAVGNKGDYLHTFPYQSNPEVQKLRKGDQLSTVQDWVKSISKPVRQPSAKRKGRSEVTGFKSPPWWEQ